MIPIGEYKMIGVATVSRWALPPLNSLLNLSHHVCKKTPALHWLPSHPKFFACLLQRETLLAVQRVAIAASTVQRVFVKTMCSRRSLWGKSPETSQSPFESPIGKLLPLSLVRYGNVIATTLAWWPLLWRGCVASVIHTL